jgi:hypothetical protein
MCLNEDFPCLETCTPKSFREVIIWYLKIGILYLETPDTECRGARQDSHIINTISSLKLNRCLPGRLG